MNLKNYFIENMLLSFIKDINIFENNINTLKNNF